MTIRLEGAFAPIELRWSWEPPAGGKDIPLRDRETAALFLADIGRWPGNLLVLRRALRDQGLPLSRLDDAAVLQQIADWAASGRLRVSSGPRREPLTSWKEAEEVEPVAARREAPSVFVEQAEAPTFPERLDVPAMVRALKEAAQAEAALCEECVKKPPRAPRRRKPKAPLSEYPADVDAGQMADAMREAAERGLPFCEECAKKKLRASAGASA